MRNFLLFTFLLFCSSNCQKDTFGYGSLCSQYVFSNIVPGNGQATLYFQLYLYNNVKGDCPIDGSITYVIYQSEKEGDPMVELAEGITADSFIVKNLKNGQPYYFKITARIGRNDAASSTILTTIPSEIPIPTPQLIFRQTDFSQSPFSFSPDGKSIAYQSFSNDPINNFGTSYIDIRDIEADTLIYKTQYDLPIIWSLGNKKVLLRRTESSGDQYNISQIYSADLTQKFETRVTDVPWDNVNAQFSQDDQDIAYFSNQGQIGYYSFWRMKSDGTQKSNITPNLRLDLNSNTLLGMSWSPDKSSLYVALFSNNNDLNGISKIDIATGNTNKIVDASWNGTFPVISPNGQQLAFLSDKSGSRDIWILNLETGAYRPVTSTQSGFRYIYEYDIHWSDKDHLIFAAVNTNSAFCVAKIKI
jgi:Tol biopolymer transport system component